MIQRLKFAEKQSGRNVTIADGAISVINRDLKLQADGLINLINENSAIRRKYSLHTISGYTISR